MASTVLIRIKLIDDFQARSSDELSLAKGDRVELVERDDEFGDGWFLGKHMVKGNTGLFPEGSLETKRNRQHRKVYLSLPNPPV